MEISSFGMRRLTRLVGYGEYCVSALPWIDFETARERFISDWRLERPTS